MTVPRAPISLGINVTFMFHSFFNSLAKLRYLSFFSLSFNFTQLSARVAIPQFGMFFFFFFSFFFFDYYQVWLSGRDLVTRLYLKIPEKFVRLFLQERFWVMHIPFVRMVKCQFFARFPVDHLAYPVFSSFILLLC